MAGSTATTTAAAKLPASSSAKAASDPPRSDAKRSSSSTSAKAAPAKTSSARKSSPTSRGGAGSLAARATSASQGKKLVLLGTVGTGVLAIVAAYGPQPKNASATDLARRNPFRIMLGVFVAGTILAALAEVQPKLAAAFSMLMLTTAAFVIGGDAWQGIASITRVEPIDPSSALANVPKTPAPITAIGK